jgi:hypothetical protein
MSASMTKIEHRAVIKFLTNQGKSAPTILHYEVTTQVIVKKVENLVLEDARLKKKQLAAIIGVSETSFEYSTSSSWDD